MFRMRAWWLVLASLVGLAGCCFTPGAATTSTSAPPTTVAFDPAHSGEGVLPTPAPLFAGVDAPYPDPQAARGTQGAIVRSGSATVTLASGALAGVTTGTVCSYTEYRVTTAGELDCRWNVTCGGYVLYGLANGGYQRCEDASWPPGTLMFDPNTSAHDTDPSFIFNSGGLSVSDDAAGRLGAFTVTMSVP